MLIFGGAVCLLLLGAIQWQEFVQNAAAVEAAKLPHVSVVEAKVDNIESGIPVGTIIVRNTSQATAYHFNMIVRFAFQPYPLIQPLAQVPPYPADASRLETTLGPGVMSRLRQKSVSNAPLSEAAKAQFKNGSAAFYLYGRLNYASESGNKFVERFSFISGGKYDAMRDGTTKIFRADIIPDD
jgi:hypothetical protein